MLYSMRKLAHAMIFVAAVAVCGIAQEARATIKSCGPGVITSLVVWSGGEIDVRHSASHATNFMRVEPAAAQVDRDRMHSLLLAAYLSGRPVELQLDVITGSLTCGSISSNQAIKYVWLQ